MPSEFLQMQKISFSYPDGRKVLHDIDLKIHAHDLIVIRGDSGAGKSTFLKLFNRFCDASHGDIYFHRRPLKEHQIDLLRSSVIYLPQLPVMIDGSILDNLFFPFTFHTHRHKTFDHNKAAKWLEYFQLDLPLEHDALKLSIGQRQRVALIRSLILEPEVLLLDEPGSALDPRNKTLIEEKVEELTRDSKVTVLMATHSEVSFRKKSYRMFSIKDMKLRESM